MFFGQISYLIDSIVVKSQLKFKDILLINLYQVISSWIGIQSNSVVSNLECIYITFCVPFNIQTTDGHEVATEVKQTTEHWKPDWKSMQVIFLNDN